MPKISDIQETPNPNAVKFILKEPVSNGTARQFASSADAADDPLARALFEVGEVASVFYMDRMITVEKGDGADWDESVAETGRADSRRRIHDRSGQRRSRSRRRQPSRL